MITTLEAIRDDAIKQVTLQHEANMSLYNRLDACVEELNRTGETGCFIRISPDLKEVFQPVLDSTTDAGAEECGILVDETLPPNTIEAVNDPLSRAERVAALMMAQ